MASEVLKARVGKLAKVGPAETPQASIPQVGQQAEAVKGMAQSLFNVGYSMAKTDQDIKQQQAKEAERIHKENEQINSDIFQLETKDKIKQSYFDLDQSLTEDDYLNPGVVQSKYKELRVGVENELRASKNINKVEFEKIKSFLNDQDRSYLGKYNNKSADSIKKNNGVKLDDRIAAIKTSNLQNIYNSNSEQVKGGVEELAMALRAARNNDPLKYDLEKINNILSGHAEELVVGQYSNMINIIDDGIPAEPTADDFKLARQKLDQLKEGVSGEFGQQYLQENFGSLGLEKDEIIKKIDSKMKQIDSEYRSQLEVKEKDSLNDIIKKNNTVKNDPVFAYQESNIPVNADQTGAFGNYLAYVANVKDGTSFNTNTEALKYITENNMPVPLFSTTNGEAKQYQSSTDFLTAGSLENVFSNISLKKKEKVLNADPYLVEEFNRQTQEMTGYDEIQMQKYYEEKNPAFKEIMDKIENTEKVANVKLDGLLNNVDSMSLVGDTSSGATLNSFRNVSETTHPEIARLNNNLNTMINKRIALGYIENQSEDSKKLFESMNQAEKSFAIRSWYGKRGNRKFRDTLENDIQDLTNGYTEDYTFKSHNEKDFIIPKEFEGADINTAMEKAEKKNYYYQRDDGTYQKINKKDFRREANLYFDTAGTDPQMGITFRGRDIFDKTGGSFSQTYLDLGSIKEE